MQRTCGCQPCATPDPFTMQVSSSLQRTNADLAEALTHALHCRLRWGGRPEDAASLAVLLLKVKIAHGSHQRGVGWPAASLAVLLLEVKLISGLLGIVSCAQKFPGRGS